MFFRAWRRRGRPAPAADGRVGWSTVEGFLESGAHSAVLTSPATAEEVVRQLDGAVRVDGDHVAVEADRIALAAWLSWARALAGAADTEQEVGARLFLLLAEVDGRGLGRRSALPGELRSVLSGQPRDPAGWLAAQSVDLAAEAHVGGPVAEVAARAAVAWARAAVLLTGDGGPLADHWSTLAAAASTARRITGDPRFLDQAVQACRQAVATCTAGARAEHLVNLALGLLDRFAVRPDVADATEATDVAGQAVAAVPADGDARLRVRARSVHAVALTTAARTSPPPVRGALADRAVAELRAAVEACRLLQDGPAADAVAARELTTLCEALRERAEHGGDSAGLGEAEAIMTAVLTATAAHDPDLARRRAVLAAVLVAGQPAELEPAVTLYEAAHAVLPPDDPRRAAYLTNLGHALILRYENRPAWPDLRRALAAHLLAVHIAPTQVEAMGNLGVALARWYDRTSRPQHLDRAVAALRRATEATLDDDSRAATLFANLAGLLLERAARGDDTALGEAVTAAREALGRTAADDPDRARRTHNLALALESTFDRDGNPGTLDEAVETHRRACALDPTPLTHARLTSALASALHTRYWTRGARADLDEAVALHRSAVDELPAEHSDQARLRSNLASALLTRSRETSSTADARVAVEIMTAALAATTDSADRPYRLDTLGSALTRLAEMTGDQHAASEAVRTGERAVTATASIDTEHHVRLRHLGDALLLRFELAADPADLDAAVDAYAAAASPDSTDRALDRYCLAGSLVIRALRQTDSEARASDLHRARAAWRAAAEDPIAPLRVRIAAAESWAEHALADDDRAAAMENAAAHLRRLCGLQLPRADRERQLTEWAGLGSDAGAALLAAGRPGRALELLDSTRALMWQQNLQLRTEPDRLAELDPELAARFTRTARALAAAERATGVRTHAGSDGVAAP